MVQFSGQRHRLIVNNIANLSTPHFVPTDVSVEQFQEQLSEAVDKRRDRSGNRGGPLPLADTHQVEARPNGLVLRPEPIHDNILFHDGNDRDVERTMQNLVENFSTFRLAAQLLRNRLDLINTAIRERV
jgi:flagellar basal-body rod protein FlgB